ncbi:ABC transporter permease [Yinghuangia sp. ASG 101]|uniref:ABC transporter permease n=1 Tax=Yinghuangia sp. ASG 101 TaxID=2896848 RepID=UPI001E3DA6A2|nr:ABC transporter permease [Yinghuangia sp. ASG 101]UGQ12682.1 ABC transporter permease [Yinghuangia sp. ASG 101]
MSPPEAPAEATVDAVPEPPGVTRKSRTRPVSPATVAGTVLLALLVLAAVSPGVFTGTSPTGTDPVNALQGPSGAHWFGTDQLGRDVFARVVHGARTSLLIGLGATALALAAGTVVGLGATLGGRVADHVLMRVADVLLALPEMLLALLIVTIMGRGTVNVVIAVALAAAPGYARLVRAEALVVRRSGYVEAAAVLGLPRRVVVVRHVLPNAIGPLLVMGTIGFGTALINASGLSFLGLGAQPPSPEWGAMLSEGRNYLDTAWWIGVFPGAAVTLAVIAVNVTGRRARLRFHGGVPR